MSRRSSARRTPPRPTVVLDFGGVLSAGHDPIDVIWEIVGGDRGQVAAAYWEHRLDYDTGRSTPAEYWGAVAAAGAIGTADVDVVSDLQDADDRYWLRLDPEARSLIHDLARSGTRLVLLSNASAAFGEAVRKADWFEAFAFAIISGEERLAKPDPEIYEILLSALAHETGGVAQPRSVIFFDDREDNVAAARSLGIDARVWPRNDPERGEGVANPGVAMAREVLVGHGIDLD